MKYFFILIWVFVFFIPNAAHALCVGTTLNAVPSTVTFQGSGGEYNVYDTSQYIQQVDFQVQTIASVGGCKYFVTLSPGSSGSTNQRYMVRGSDHLNYNATATSGGAILRDTGTHNGAGVISGSLGFILNTQQTANHSFFWTITPSQVFEATPTRFQDSNLTLRVWAELALGVYTNSDTKNITFQSKVESSVDLALVDTAGAFNISDTTQTVDFGDLTSGEFLSYDTVIRSNDGYILKLQSQNSQTLKHTVAATTVPYSVLFGGGTLNLASGNQVTAATSTGTTPATGDRFQTRFTVGTLNGAEPAGNYQDIISVTLSAN